MKSKLFILIVAVAILVTAVVATAAPPSNAGGMLTVIGQSCTLGASCAIGGSHDVGPWTVTINSGATGAINVTSPTSACADDDPTASLAGFANLTGVVTLTIGTSIDADEPFVAGSGLTALTLVDNGGSISSVDLSASAGLTAVNVSGNANITSLDLPSSSASLASVNVSGTGVTHLTMGGLAAVPTITGSNLNVVMSGNVGNTLTLSNTGITSLDISGMTGLTTVNVSGCTNLNSLVLPASGLTALNVNGCSGLTGALNLSGHTGLSALDVGGTGISSVTASAADLATVALGNNTTSLTLNGLTAAAPAYPTITGGPTANNLAVTMSGDVGTSLTLANTHIGTLDMSGLTGLTTVSLNGCTNLTNLTLASGIVNLNISGTAIQTLTATGPNALQSVTLPTSIKTVNLQNSANLTSVTFPNPAPNVTSVNLGGTHVGNVTINGAAANISTLTLPAATYLTTLDLTGCTNQTTMPSLAGYTNLATLKLGGTKITTVNVTNSTALTSANVTLPTTLTSLTMTGCTNAGMTTLNVAAMPNLATVNLTNSSNMATVTFPSPATKLTTVNLTGTKVAPVTINGTGTTAPTTVTLPNYTTSSPTAVVTLTGFFNLTVNNLATINNLGALDLHGSTLNAFSLPTTATGNIKSTLATLNLNGCTGVASPFTANGYTALATLDLGATAVTQVSITGDPALTDAGLTLPASGLTHLALVDCDALNTVNVTAQAATLKELDLHDSGAIATVTFPAAPAAMPALEKVDLGGTVVTSVAINGSAAAAGLAVTVPTTPTSIAVTNTTGAGGLRFTGLDAVTNLQTLDLHGSTMGGAPFNPPVTSVYPGTTVPNTLVTLDLHDCKNIANPLDLTGYKALQNLNLSGIMAPLLSGLFIDIASLAQPNVLLPRTLTDLTIRDVAATAVSLPLVKWELDPDIFLRLKNLIIDCDILDIKPNAFPACVHLETLDLTKCASMTAIGDGAFDGGIALKQIIWPTANTVFTTIGENAFRLAGAQYRYPYIVAPAPQQTASYLPGNLLPSTLTTIGKDAFAGSSLSGTVTLPNAAAVGAGAFRDSRVSVFNVTGSKITSADLSAAFGDGVTAANTVTVAPLPTPNPAVLPAVPEANIPLNIVQNCSSLVNLQAYDIQTPATFTDVNLPASKVPSLRISNLGKNPLLANVNHSGTLIERVNTYSGPSVGNNLYLGMDPALADVNLQDCRRLWLIEARAFHKADGVSAPQPYALASLLPNVSAPASAWTDFVYPAITKVNIEGCDALERIEQEAFAQVATVNISQTHPQLNYIGDYAFEQVTFSANKVGNTGTINVSTQYAPLEYIGDYAFADSNYDGGTAASPLPGSGVIDLSHDGLRSGRRIRYLGQGAFLNVAGVEGLNLYGCTALLGTTQQAHNAVAVDNDYGNSTYISGIWPIIQVPGLPRTPVGVPFPGGSSRGTSWTGAAAANHRTIAGTLASPTGGSAAGIGANVGNIKGVSDDAFNTTAIDWANLGGNSNMQVIGLNAFKACMLSSSIPAAHGALNPGLTKSGAQTLDCEQAGEHSGTQSLSLSFEGDSGLAYILDNAFDAADVGRLRLVCSTPTERPAKGALTYVGANNFPGHLDLLEFSENTFNVTFDTTAFAGDVDTVNYYQETYKILYRWDVNANYAEIRERVIGQLMKVLSVPFLKQADGAALDVVPSGLHDRAFIDRDYMAKWLYFTAPYHTEWSFPGGMTAGSHAATTYVIYHDVIPVEVSLDTVEAGAFYPPDQTTNYINRNALPPGDKVYTTPAGYPIVPQPPSAAPFVNGYQLLLSEHPTVIRVGDKFTVEATISPDKEGTYTWDFDLTAFNATFNSPATFTAKKPGNYSFTAYFRTPDGNVFLQKGFNVIVEPAVTGAAGTWFYNPNTSDEHNSIGLVALLLAASAVTAGVTLFRGRKNKDEQ